MVKKLNEAQLREVVSKVIRESLEETHLGDWLYDKMNTFQPKEMEYDPNASIETIAKQDGWEINTFAPKTTDTHFELAQVTAAFGVAKNGVLSPRDLIEDLQLHLGTKGKIVNIKVGKIGDVPYDVAKTLSFDIKYN